MSIVNTAMQAISSFVAGGRTGGVSQDNLVAILDNESLQQIFVASSPMAISVTEYKTATQFAVEDGTTRSDHVTIDAIEIGFDLFLSDDNARNGYEEIKQAWRENQLVTVQTKVSSYPNMMILEIPHEETLDGSIRIPIRMQEWRTYEPQFGELPPQKVKKKTQASTVKSGQKQTKTLGSSSTTSKTASSKTASKASTASEAKKKKASVLYKVFN